MTHDSVTDIIALLRPAGKWLLLGAVLTGTSPLPADESAISPEIPAQQATGPGAEEEFVVPVRLEVPVKRDTPELAAPSPGEFVSLLSTENTLDGWTAQDGRLSCWSRNGDIISCIASGGGWLRTKKVYSDFILKLEYKLEAGGNSGIGLRVGPGPGTPLEVQLLDDAAPKYSSLREDQYTGSLYYQAPTRQRASLRPAGEWNHCEVRCLGDQVRVWINSELVNEIDLAAGRQDEQSNRRAWQLSQRSPLGAIALQGHTTRVEFRNIEIHDLCVTAPNGLQHVEISLGTGEPAPEAGPVKLHYVGQLLSGKRFVDTRDVGPAAAVELEQLVPGLRQGVTGMRVGGRRRIIVPPALGYGSQAVGAAIPPDSTLVYEVELVSLGE